MKQSTQSQRSCLLSALGLVAVSLVASRPARADDVIHYTVQPGDTCGAIAKRFYDDRDLVEPIHDANGMHSPPPHMLIAGTVLLIPPRPPRAPDAQLSALKNEVEVLAPERRPGKLHDPLFRGNRVETEAASSATVTFHDETLVRLAERTLVVILGNSRSAAAQVTRPATAEANLMTGSLRAWLAGPPTSRVAVSTPAADVRIVEGEAQVSADPKKTTRLAVYAGNSIIKAAAKKEEVPAGYGSKADVGRPPTPPRRLPPAPAWTAIPETLLVDRGAGSSSFIAEYTPGTGGPAAASYHVQLARDPAFADVLVDEVVPATTTRFEAKAPRPGRWFVRVSALDDDRFEGPFGRAIAFGVLAITQSREGSERRVRLEPASLFCVRVGNAPLARVTSELRAKRQERLFVRCATSDTEPTTLVPLD